MHHALHPASFSAPRTFVGLLHTIQNEVNNMLICPALLQLCLQMNNVQANARIQTCQKNLGKKAGSNEVVQVTGSQSCMKSALLSFFHSHRRPPHFIPHYLEVNVIASIETSTRAAFDADESLLQTNKPS